MGHNKETPPKKSYSNTIGCISGHSTDIMIIPINFQNTYYFSKSVGELINDEVQIYFKAQWNAQNGAMRQVHAILAMIGNL